MDRLNELKQGTSPDDIAVDVEAGEQCKFLA